MPQDRISFQTGRSSELAVLLSLQHMRRNGIIFGFVKRDQPGVDFEITLKDQRCMPLQVKSSYSGMQKHARRFPRIPCVVVAQKYLNSNRRNTDNLLEKISQEIKELVDQY